MDPQDVVVLSRQHAQVLKKWKKSGMDPPYPPPPRPVPRGGTPGPPACQDPRLPAPKRANAPRRQAGRQTHARTLPQRSAGRDARTGRAPGRHAHATGRTHAAPCSRLRFRPATPASAQVDSAAPITRLSLGRPCGVVHTDHKRMNTRPALAVQRFPQVINRLGTAFPPILVNNPQPRQRATLPQVGQTSGQAPQVVAQQPRLESNPSASSGRRVSRHFRAHREYRCLPLPPA